MLSRTTLPCLFAIAALSLPAAALAQGAAPKAGPSGSNAGTPKTDPPKADAPKTDGATSDGQKASGDDKSGVAKVEEAPPAEKGSNMSNVTEAFERTYLFAGIRYRGVVLPKFVVDAFIEGGQTVYSNQIGLELDIRKNGFSVIPAISYAEFSTGDLLYKDKNAADFVGNYGLGNSGLKMIQLTVDLLWSAKINKVLDFEYGVGLGVGFVFGDLLNNWVREDANGRYSAANGKKYSPCAAEDAVGTGCNRKDHQNADVARVNNYLEPSWANGGSKPNVIPWVAIPQIGLRFKPIKAFEARLGLGVSLTGFWFGLSGNYGFERPVSKGPETARTGEPSVLTQIR